ncbi:LOW QUALITY PROTEIN: E3 SUMO-protein ligase ZBED1-like [Toxorhynchites rutilus septentrionalis]|uniref:LOW QUALITY PROTEIN: E3 SUMO-protein ligase ZBED1-like n=1 Tax=Toxorhynchites rutilus septentrionalis TaxID=329112 RepID=UPI0024795984|nr:LOW QUALITY PROTEIN: E3 SUMO-protein ligase ZBED1-like [Toxorhynchites rutilus septentrionalis]
MGPRQQTITSAFDRPFSYGAGGTKGKEITTCVMYMVCTDNMPLCTVDKKGFRQLMKTVCPLYKVPHETRFREILKNKFIKSKEIVRNRLRSITSICLTTDVWTEMLNVRSYLGITGHFIHDSQLHSVLLGVVECKQSKTSEYIANLLRVCCNDWGIKNETISCVTTDLGANILGAVRMEYGERRHVPCFAHTINLITSKAVPLYKEAYAARMEPVIEEDNDDELDGVEDHCTIEVSITPEKNMIYIYNQEVKTIIKFFKASETATRELRKLQLADNKKEGQCLGLVLDVRTRWNSIMAMIERFLVMAHYISRVLLVVPKTPTMLTADELSILKEICKVLHPLETVTTEMSAEKYVTISKIIPLVRLLKISYTSMQLDSAEAMSVKNSIMLHIMKYFNDVGKRKLFAVATLLDPRFKKIHFESPLTVAPAISWVGELVRTAAEESPEFEYDLRISGEPETNTTTDDLWAIHDSMVAESNRVHGDDSAGGIPIELRQYLNTTVAPRTCDPLIVWNEIRAQYPNVHKIAMQFLCNSATSVPSERLFSKAGQIMTKQRNRLWF